MVKWVFMKFGGDKHYGKKNKCTKFNLNPMHIFQEIKHSHLQLFSHFLKKRGVGFSNFWLGEA